MMDQLAAESCLIGDILIEPKLLCDTRKVVAPEDFAGEITKTVYAAACALEDAGQPVDPVTIGQKAALQGSPNLTRTLAEMMELTPTAKNYLAHAQAVHRCGMSRRLRGVLSDGVDALDRGQDPETVCGTVQTRAQTIAASAASSGLVHGADALHDLMDFRGKLEDGQTTAMLSTGFPALDNVLGGGLGPGWMCVLAARPSVGKTSLALAIAENIAARGGAVLFNSLEETSLSLTAKRLGLDGYLQPTRLLNEAHLPDGEYDRMTRAAVRLAERKVYLTSERNMTVDRLKFLARQVEGLSLVVVDYLQLLAPTTGRSRYEQVSAISRELKLAALDLEAPLLVCCQLNREAEGQMPKLSDLRDSGAIEQDADNVLLLWAPDSPDGRPKLEQGQSCCRVQMLVAKNRRGPTGGKLNFSFYPQTGVFRM